MLPGFCCCKNNPEHLLSRRRAGAWLKSLQHTKRQRQPRPWGTAGTNSKTQYTQTLLFFFFFLILLLASTKNTGVIFHTKKKKHDNWNAFFFFTSYKGQHLDFQLSHTQYHARYQSTCWKDRWGEPGTPRSLTSKIINGVSGQRALWKHANKASGDQDKIGRTLPGLHKAHCLGTTVILENVTAAFGSQRLEGGKHLRNTADSCLATAVTKRFSK